jgi:hypothetical protein
MTSIITILNSVHFEDVDIGLESNEETIPEPISRHKPALLWRLEGALSSAKLRQNSRQSSPQLEELETNKMHQIASPGTMQLLRCSTRHH